MLALTLACISCTDDDDNHNGNQVNNTDYSASADFRVAIPLADLTNLSLEAVSGEIVILGVPNFMQDSIIVQGERRVESDSDADAQAHLQYLQVLTNASEHILSVRTDQPEQTEGRNYIVEYHIEVPEEFIVTASQVNGTVWINDMNADVIVSAVNGNLHVSGAGTAAANVVNGFLSFESYVGTVHGSVVNGGIHAEVSLPLEGNCDLSITNGNIDLELPDTTSAHISANVVNGQIEVRDFTVSNPVITPHSFIGILGVGDGSITLDAVNGNILVQPFGI
jgi:hypothetical protein